MQITKTAQTAIYEHYGVKNASQLIAEQSDMLSDSVVDGFCTNCGSHFGDVEPDAIGYHCPECNKDSVASIVCILIE